MPATTADSRLFSGLTPSSCFGHSTSLQLSGRTGVDAASDPDRLRHVSGTFGGGADVGHLPDHLLQQLHRRQPQLLHPRLAQQQQQRGAAAKHAAADGFSDFFHTAPIGQNADESAFTPPEVLLAMTAKNEKENEIKMAAVSCSSASTVAADKLPHCKRFPSKIFGSRRVVTSGLRVGGASSTGGANMTSSAVATTGNGSSSRQERRRHRRATERYRTAHATRERVRVEAFNAAFGRLRCMLPTLPPDKKLSKIEILRLAICYITFLDHVLDLS